MERTKRSVERAQPGTVGSGDPRFPLFAAGLVVALLMAALLLPQPVALGQDATPTAPPSPPTPTPDKPAAGQFTLPVPLVDPSFLSHIVLLAETPPTPPPQPPPPTATPAPPPTPTPLSSSTAPSGAPVRIIIDAVGLDHSVVAVGLDEQRIPIVPRHDVGWYQLSAQPGAGDNVVLWGHVLRFADTPDAAAPFARLHELGAGSRIRIETEQGGSYAYTVEEQIWATPDQVEYILPQGSERLTLVSCIGDQVIVNGSVEDMTHRLITIARPAR